MINKMLNEGTSSRYKTPPLPDTVKVYSVYSIYPVNRKLLIYLSPELDTFIGSFGYLYLIITIPEPPSPPPLIVLPPPPLPVLVYPGVGML